MKSVLLLTFLLLLVGPAALGQYVPEEQPAVDGFVTRVTSASDFDVNGMRILCGQHTASGWSNNDTFFSGCPSKTPHLGDSITVFGKLQKQSDVIDATRIVQHPPLVIGGDVAGEAVVDAPPIRNAPGFPAGTIMVRADGYWIVLPFQAKITLWGSMKSVEDIDVNSWIDYKGRMRRDGVVVASEVKLMPNVVTRKEDKLRNKVNYDPASAAAAGKQSSFERAITGVDYSRIPPWPDAAMQARVAAIGEKLIPEYQKNLADSDPSKLRFRFQAVDSNWGLFPISLPDGTILIPGKGVERMQNDSELAALLADSVATVLEKQRFRLQATVKALTTANLAELALGLLPTPVAIAGWGGAEVLSIDGSEALRRETEQSQRVSLTLMHDAGFDITQAPLAWWLVAAGKKPIAQTRPPRAVPNLYHVLQAVWTHPQPGESTAPVTR